MKKESHTLVSLANGGPHSLGEAGWDRADPQTIQAGRAFFSAPVSPESPTEMTLVAWDE